MYPQPTNSQKPFGLRDLVAVLTVIGLIAGGVTYGYTEFQTKENAVSQEQRCLQRSEDMKAYIREMRDDIKEDIKELQREIRRSN